MRVPKGELKKACRSVPSQWYRSGDATSNRRLLFAQREFFFVREREKRRKKSRPRKRKKERTVDCKKRNNGEQKALGSGKEMKERRKEGSGGEGRGRGRERGKGKGEGAWEATGAAHGTHNNCLDPKPGFLQPFFSLHWSLNKPDLQPLSF